MAIKPTRPQGPLLHLHCHVVGASSHPLLGVTLWDRRCPLRTSSKEGLSLSPQEAGSPGPGPGHTRCLFSWKQPMKPHSLSFHSGFRHNSETLLLSFILWRSRNKTLRTHFSTTQITRERDQEGPRDKKRIQETHHQLQSVDLMGPHSK